jgi:hypothetical protein
MGNVLFGYRALSQDLQSQNADEFKFDTTIHGPFLEVSIGFRQWYNIK